MGLISSAVGDHVRNPGDDLFCIFAQGEWGQGGAAFCTKGESVLGGLKSSQVKSLQCSQ